MSPAPGAAVPAGAGDLAVAAAFAAGADSEMGKPRGDRSDSGSASSSDDERGNDGDDTGIEPSRRRPIAAGPDPEFEFSDEETRRAVPGVIRDGSDSSEWSDSGDDEDVEELDLANMPKWLEDIKNNVKSDFDDDAAHAEPPRTKNEIAADAVPPPPPPPPVGPEEALVAVGEVISVVGDVVVVQSLPGLEPMDEASVLCLETRQGLGAIEEVFGPVAAPLYAMRVPAARRSGAASAAAGGNEAAAAGRETTGDDATDDCARTQLFSPLRSPASHLVIKNGSAFGSAALYSLRVRTFLVGCGCLNFELSLLRSEGIVARRLRTVTGTGRRVQ